MMRLIAFLAVILLTASAGAVSYRRFRNGWQHKCQRRSNSDPFWAGLPV
jgi:hypothetical protein